MASLKNYLAVKFRNNTHGVVPRSWIIKDDDDYLAYWPKKKAEEKARASATPEYKWKIYKVEILAQASTFDSCNGKLYTPGGLSITVEEGSSDGEESTSLSSIEEEITAAVGEQQQTEYCTLSNTPVPMQSPCQCGDEIHCIGRRVTKILRFVSELVEYNREQNQMQKLNELQVELIEVRRPSMMTADTVQQLDQLADDPNLISYWQSKCIGVSEHDTIRKILKQSMTKELAIQFSYTGLGHRRQPGKLPFGHHPLCTKIFDNAMELNLDHPRSVLADHIKVCLRSCRDWHGGRSRRPSTAGVTGASSTAGVTGASSAAGATGAPSADGTTGVPFADSTTEAPSAAGATGAPSAAGVTEAPTAAGVTGAPSAAGVTGGPSAAGVTGALSAAGATGALSAAGAIRALS